MKKASGGKAAAKSKKAEKSTIEVHVLIKLPKPRQRDPVEILLSSAIRWPHDLDAFAARLKSRREKNLRHRNLRLIVADKLRRRVVARTIILIIRQMQSWLVEEPERFTWPKNRALPERLLRVLQASCDDVPPRAWPSLHSATKKFADFTRQSAPVRFSLMTMRDDRDEVLPL